MPEEKVYLRRLLGLGVPGYVVKRSREDELIGAIRHVARGGFYFDPAVWKLDDSRS